MGGLLCLAEVALEDLVLGAPGSTPKAELRDFIIVTGVGNNSPGGIALIRPAVIAFLREDLDIAVLETRHDGPGRLRVPAHELRTRTAHGEGEGGVPRPAYLEGKKIAPALWRKCCWILVGNDAGATSHRT
ncbi:unnamed protein product [Effrenium voratum]|uniref:Smr domain-containing protein n=1 Tax=Effrenium voratum TaxID=2562239 RepID=A0AA36JA02_9DINO|nr:unnamed protein product [Effrenium voratum]